MFGCNFDYSKTDPVCSCLTCFCVSTLSFHLSTDKTIKLWKVSERDKKVEGYNTKEETGQARDPSCITQLRVSFELFAPCFANNALGISS